jgi:hypothetical protein
MTTMTGREPGSGRQDGRAARSLRSRGCCSLAGAVVLMGIITYPPLWALLDRRQRDQRPGRHPAARRIVHQPTATVIQLSR